MITNLMLAALIGAGLQSASPGPLSLAEAIHIARQQPDPSVSRYDAAARAARHRGEAAAVLPDPVVSAAIMNLPLTTLDPSGDPMSQLRLSLRQMFPRGDSLRLSRSQERARAREERARRDLAVREIILDVRNEWLEQRYWELAREQTLQRLSTLQDLSGVLLSAYAAGRQNSHEVIRSDLETQILQNRLTEIDQQADMARARLARYVGDEALHRRAAMSDVRLPALPEGQEALTSLARHPAVAILEARIDVRETGVELAEQQYQPAWGVEAGYGLRFGRSDTATIGVSFEMPLFERTRQDETVLAAREEVAAAEYSRQALLLDLRRALQIEQARINRLDSAIALQRSGIIPAALETREAVLLAYENQTADYSELVQAELTLLDAELTLLRLDTDRSVAAAQILYLTGDVQ